MISTCPYCENNICTHSIEFPKHSPSSLIFPNLQSAILEVPQVNGIHPTNHSNSVKVLILSSDDKYIITGSYDKTICIWNLLGLHQEAVLKGHSGFVCSLAITNNNIHLVSGSYDKTIKIWDFQKKNLKKTLNVHQGPVLCVATTNDSNFFVSGGWDMKVKIWEFESFLQVKELNGHLDAIACVVVGKSDDFLMSASWDRTIFLWDLSRAEKIMEIRNDSLIRCLEISKDNNCLAFPDGKILKIFEIERGVVSKKLEGHKDSITCIAFTKDSDSVISGSADLTIRLWDLATCEGKFIMSGHSKIILCLGISRNSQVLLSSGGDCEVIIWGISSQKKICSMPVYKQKVSKVLLTKNCSYAMTSAKNMEYIWDLTTKNQLSSLTSHMEFSKLAAKGRYFVLTCKNNTAFIIKSAKKPVSTLLKKLSELV